MITRFPNTKLNLWRVLLLPVFGWCIAILCCAGLYAYGFRPCASPNRSNTPPMRVAIRASATAKFFGAANFRKHLMHMLCCHFPDVIISLDLGQITSDNAISRHLSLIGLPDATTREAIRAIYVLISHVGYFGPSFHYENQLHVSIAVRSMR